MGHFGLIFLSLLSLLAIAANKDYWFAQSDHQPRAHLNSTAVLAVGFLGQL